MRVYELAWALRIEASAALTLVKGEGEYVTSHLSQVAQPVADRIIASPPPPTRPPHKDVGSDYIDAESARRASLEPRSLWVVNTRRRRGPARLTGRLPVQPERCWDHSPPCECEYKDEITTWDAAQIFRVKPATIRQWVHKGYLKPSGRLGVSNTFLLTDLQIAAKAVKARRRAPSVSASRQDGAFIRTNRLPHRYDDRLLSIPESAALLGLSTSTIRSWIHRRILAWRFHAGGWTVAG